MSDLQPLLLMVCRTCRAGDLAGPYEPDCAFCAAMANDALGLAVPIPLRPARTREELVEGGMRALAYKQPDNYAEAVLIAAGVIQPKEATEDA